MSQFNLEDAQNFPIEFHVSFIQRCKFNMAIIKRSKIVINKRDTSWNALIDLLRKCIDCLSTYGPKFEVEILAKSGFNILEKMIKTELRRRADAAAYEDQHMSNENGDVDRYNNLSLAAQFCEVVRYERKKTPHKFSMQDFKFDPKYQLSSDSTMALLYEHPVTPNSTEHRVILIEWTKDLDHHQKRDTKIKAIILASPKPRQLLLPFCYGVVEDPATHRWGLVLAPPAHIGSNLPVKLPTGSISQYRMPVSLKDLLERKHPSYMHTLSLGIRFRLAKKLVGAIHMMHCIGWVHKCAIMASPHSPKHELTSTPGISAQTPSSSSPQRSLQFTVV